MNSIKKSFRINTNVKRHLSDQDLAELTNMPVGLISEMREIFRLIDVDGSNTLSMNELKLLLENLHYDTVLMDDGSCPFLRVEF